MSSHDDRRRQHDETLTAAILAATSGSACARAEALLPELADPGFGLDALEQDLLAAHLAHCPDCRALADCLSWLARALPAMARVEPDPDFPAAVLAAIAREDAAALLPRAGERFLAWWRRCWQRPRFALEAAYAGTLIVVALTATPVSPLREAPERALALVKSPPSLAAALPIDLGQVTSNFSDSGEAIIDSGGRELGAARQQAGVRLAAWRQRVAPAAGELWRDLRALASSLGRRDWAAASSRLSEILGDLKRLGRAWRVAPAATTSTTTIHDAASSGRT